MKEVEVCLTPALFSARTLQQDCIIVVIDVLRATTSFCAAFDAGVQEITPVGDLEELKHLQILGYATAAERDGIKVDFADFGNSPTQFLKSGIMNSKLAYSTTNGTRAIHMAREGGKMITACFSNLRRVSRYLQSIHLDVLILCSGWKNGFSLEDTVCAGAIAESLLINGNRQLAGDAAFASIKLWSSAQSDLKNYCSSGEHYRRLEKLNLHHDLDYSFNLDTSESLPFWNGKFLLNHP